MSHSMCTQIMGLLYALATLYFSVATVLEMRTSVFSDNLEV